MDCVSRLKYVMVFLCTAWVVWDQAGLPRGILISNPYRNFFFFRVIPIKIVMPFFQEEYKFILLITSIYIFFHVLNLFFSSEGHTLEKKDIISRHNSIKTDIFQTYFISVQVFSLQPFKIINHKFSTKNYRLFSIMEVNRQIKFSDSIFICMLYIFSNRFDWGSVL